MTILFHRNFEKQYKKLHNKLQERVKERLALFLMDEFDPLLNNHPLQGRYAGYRSINIAGDIRALYKFYKPTIRIFIAIDTHGNLYK